MKPRPEEFPGLSVDSNGYHGAKKAWRQGLVDFDLAQTCEELNGLVGVFERNATGEVTGASLEFLLQKREELESQLSLSYGQRVGVNSMEAVLSICMRLYMAGILARMPFGLEGEAIMVPVWAQQLRRSITREMVDEKWSQCLGFFLWVFLAGSFLEVDNPVRQWLLEESRPMVARLASGGLTLEHCKFLVQGYLWSEPFCDSQGHLFWQEAVDLAGSRQ